MKPEQPASHGRTIPANTADNKLDGSVSNTAAESNLEDTKSINPEVASLIKIIERLTTEKTRQSSRLQRFLTHQLFLIIVSGIIGVGLTHYYTLKQKDIDYQRSLQQLELTSQRSFSDELNKVRIQKIGEVWEQIDKNEITLDDLLNKANQASGSNKEYFDKIKSLIEQDLVMVNKNRFWLGKPAYNELNNYLDTTRQIVFDMLLGQPGIDLSEPLRKREQAKQDVERIRDMFLAGAPELGKPPASAGR